MHCCNSSYHKGMSRAQSGQLSHYTLTHRALTSWPHVLSVLLQSWAKPDLSMQMALQDFQMPVCSELRAIKTCITHLLS